MNIKEILADAVKKNASDVFIISGAALAYKISGRVATVSNDILMPDDTRSAVLEIFRLAAEKLQRVFVDFRKKAAGFYTCRRYFA